MKKTKKIKNATYYSVNIPCKNNSAIEKLFELEYKLSKRGITFDTGYCFADNSRDWELDWSLKGGTAEEVMNVLKKNKIKFQATERNE